MVHREKAQAATAGGRDSDMECCEEKGRHRQRQGVVGGGGIGSDREWWEGIGSGVERWEAEGRQRQR